MLNCGLWSWFQGPCDRGGPCCIPGGGGGGPRKFCAAVEADRSAYCVGVGPGSLEVVAGPCDRVPVGALGTDLPEGVLGTRAGVVCSLRVVVVVVPGEGAVVGCACVLEESDQEVLVILTAASATTG